jgi:hypothetical protein
LKFEISDEMQRRQHHKALEPQIRAAMADEGKAKATAVEPQIKTDKG